MILKTKNIFLILILTVTTIFGLNACSSTSSKPANTTVTKTVENNSNGNGNAETTTVHKTTVEKKDGEPSETTIENNTKLTASSGDKIGVPECDEYIEKYEACITGKVPEAVRQQLKTSFEMTRKSWKDLAANPNTKSSLASACKQSQEAAKKSMSAYQCDW